MTKLQYYRVEKGLSKRQLALKAGVSDNVIRRIEKRESYGNVTLQSFKKLADALGVELFELIEPDLLD